MERDTSAADFASADKAENRSRGLRRSAVAASALLHAALFAALFALRPAPSPDSPVIPVMLLADGLGSAGAAGGQGGAGTRASNSAPAQETDATAAAPPDAATEAKPHPAAEPIQKAAPEATAVAQAPAAPPHKPTRPQPRKLARRKQPPPAASRLPSGEVAGIPGQRPTRLAGTPGAQSGPAGGSALGQGVEGQGQGAIGAAPGEGPGDDYLDRVRRWLERFKYYPKAAQREKEEGQLILGFTILRDGTVVAPQIEHSSGFPLLDQAALRMLRDASPVPPLPDRYPAARVTLSMPVDYSLGFFERLF